MDQLPVLRTWTGETVLIEDTVCPPVFSAMPGGASSSETLPVNPGEVAPGN